MTKTFKIFKKIFKWLAAIVVALLTILFIIQVVIIVYFDKIIEDTLKETVRSSTEDLYSIDFDHLYINVFTGTITGKKVVLKPDTLLYKRLKEVGTAPTLLFDIYVPVIKISRVNIYTLYFDHHLQVNKIYFESPIVGLLNEPGNQKKKEKNKNPLDLYPLISSTLKKAEANSIEINKGSFVFKKIKDSDSFSYELSKLSVNFQQVLIDSTAYSDTTNFFYSDDIEMTLVDHLIKLPDSLYNLTLGKTYLSTKKSLIKLENLHLVPKYKKFDFGRKHGHQTDRLDIKIGNIQLNKVNLRQLLDHQKIIFDELLIDHTWLYAYRDKRVPFDYSKHPKIPQQILRELDTYLIINKIRIRHLNITYEETPPSGGQSGVVTFKDVFARITDISNDSIDIRNGQTVWITAEGYLMGKGLLKAKFKIPLNAPNDTYYIWGSLYNMNFKEMNPVIKPLAAVEIKDGEIKKMNFDLRVNNTKATGTVKMHYNSLKIQIINKEDGNVGLKEKLASFIANNFIVISDNPKNNDFRVGQVDYPRNDHKFVFNYWWKALLTGIKPSIGFDEETQASIKQFTTKREERKKKREERRKNRKEKRLAKKQKD